MKININTYLIIFILIPFLFISIIYASFSTELMIDGIAYLRIPAEIRITNLKVIEQTNGAYETYSSEYNKDTTKTYVTLPDLSSSITYEVTISNNSSTDYDLSSISIVNDTNVSIEYNLDIEVGSLISSNSEKSFTITIFYNTDNLPNNTIDTLIIKYKFIEHINPYIVATYDYTGEVQTFTAPHNGIYKLEVWGAQGGSYSDECKGGYGGYSTGEIQLNSGSTFYVIIGGAGTGNGTHTTQLGGYNGGGNTLIDNDLNTIQSSGGGATHIASNNRGELKNYESYTSELIIVAGGGGGSAGNKAIMCVTSGSGGGMNGANGETYTETYENKVRTGIGLGGTQTSGGTYITNFTEGYYSVGAFGQGGSSIYNGGGGGYYGGGTGHSSAGGGSGYIGNTLLINKYMTCYNCESSDTFTAKTVSTTKVSEQPKSDTSKIGNGYAKITFIKRIY